MSHPLATIPGTEVWTLDSARIGQQYQISVALPLSYRAQPERRYPTIYLIDGNLYFGLVTDLTRNMARCGAFPEVIVVGIGYPLGDDLAVARKQIDTLRTRDLTPVVVPAEEAFLARVYDVPALQTGGAAAFLDFIRGELVPRIDGEYRTEPKQRVLAGHSFGGLFTLYTLFHQPSLFHAYVASSPSLFFGDRAMAQYEAEFAQRRKRLSARLYLGVGIDEEHPHYPMHSEMVRFVAQLESRDYKGLMLTKQFIANVDHCGVVAPTFQAGLQAVLS